jgi:hypothetical protein
LRSGASASVVAPVAAHTWNGGMIKLAATTATHTQAIRVR